MNNRFRKFVPFLAALLLLVLLASCGGPATPAATPTPQATAIPPTPTSAPAELIRVTTQAATADSAAKPLTDFAQANSLQYRTLTALTSADITSGTKIVVLDGAPADLSSLAAGAPSVQFILLGAANADKLSNVSGIVASADDEAFMAGYLTALIAQDWRAGALVSNDGPAGAAYAADFTNGAQFVCGKCNPFYSPIVAFPVTAAEAASSPSTTWATDAATLGQDWLSAVFITPSAATADVIAAVTSHTVNSDGVYLVSTTAAPQDGSIPWVGLVGSDYSAALTNLLPKALQGQGGQTVRAQISLTALNEDIVSPAKQALFNQTAAALAADQIIPTTVQ
jgi:Uncharacterized ABC-type transport system, periplasmic component/surface lipoprotein